MLEEGRAIVAGRVVAFINTLHCPDGDDVLADGRGPAWLTDWLGVATLGERDRISRDAWAGLQTLREGLRQLAAANNGVQPDGQTLARAAAVLESARLVVDLGDHRQPPRLLASAGADAAGHGVAAATQSYIAIRATGDWSRVKACAAPECRWAYLDTSRNRSRRWCDMTDCGNRAKNRAWRERRRAVGDHRASTTPTPAPGRL